MEADEILRAAEAFHSAMLIASPDGCILAVSGKAPAFLGIPSGSLHGRPLFEILEDEETGVREYLRMCMRTTHPMPGSFTFKCQPNVIMKCRVEGAALRLTSRTEHDAVILSLSRHSSATRKFLLLNTRIDQLSKEVRERKALAAENICLLKSEQAARATAEQANRLKDEFLAILSHELRTPLNAILGWSTLLENNSLDHGARTNGLQAIQRAARAQAEMINDILDISRIIAGKIRLNLEPCDLTDVIRNALDAVRPAAAAKGIALRTTVVPDDGRIIGDPERLQQVLWNLVSNAVKFTPQGGEVHVSLARCEGGVDITVSDTGIGIGRDMLPYVFDRFRQADSSSTRRHGGLGLGLAISQQLTQLHGGTLSASSAGDGCGSSFTLTLPLKSSLQEVGTAPAPADPPKDERARPLAKDLRLAGARLLLVEDDQESREMLYQVLRQFGAEVRATANARDALSEVDAFHPDCLISDIEMPGEDGYSLIRKIRSRESSQDKMLPAVAVTAYARAQDRIRALEAGFQMHVAKPIETSELIAVLMILLGRQPVAEAPAP